MKTINENELNKLLNSSGQCVSLYMPAHQSHPANQKDPLRFRALVKQLEDSLLQSSSKTAVRTLLQPLHELSDNHSFWSHTPEGLAMFCSKNFFEVYGLPLTVPELALVSDSFHTKPLRRYLQAADRYHVLGLTLSEFRMYEGNRHSLVELDLPPGISGNIKDILGHELTEEHITVASYGGAGANKSSMHHGHGGRKDEIDKDAERFFREVSKIVHEHFSKPSGLPLILAALPEHHRLFQSVSKNPLLVKQGVTSDPFSLGEAELVSKVWKILEPSYFTLIRQKAEEFGNAKANDLGSDQPEEVAKAAVAGRVGTVLLEAGRILPGRVNDKGRVTKGDLEHPEVEDLLDDIGEIVIAKGGDVMVVPKKAMPTETGIAAAYRY